MQFSKSLCSCTVHIEKNSLIMRKVRREWPDWLEHIEKLWQLNHYLQLWWSDNHLRICHHLYAYCCLPCSSFYGHSLQSSKGFFQHVTKQKSSQTASMNMMKSSLYFSGLSSQVSESNRTPLGFGRTGCSTASMCSWQMCWKNLWVPKYCAVTQFSQLFEMEAGLGTWCVTEASVTSHLSLSYTLNVSRLIDVQ